MAVTVGEVMERGKLRVYLGAAPGVGKTYAMLDEGRRRAERGTDVVVGFVETHGRPHTAALLEGMEIIPRREISYRGANFTEMDLEAVLARRQAVARSRRSSASGAWFWWGWESAPAPRCWWVRVVAEPRSR